MMPTANVLKKTRFDAVESDGEAIAGSTVYTVAAGASLFEVRVSDDEACGAAIVRPADANALPEARCVVDFIVSTLNREIIEVYVGAFGHFQRIDNQTLECRRD